MNKCLLKKILKISIATCASLAVFLTPMSTSAAPLVDDYKEGDTVVYSYTGKASDDFLFTGKGTKTYTISEDGTYTLYLKGQSGLDTLFHDGGEAGYISGTIDLKAGDILTVEIGQTNGGKSAAADCIVGFVGEKNDEAILTTSGNDGGYASRILVNGKTVLIAAGGGGASALANGISAENVVYGTADDASVLEGISGEAGGGGAGYEAGEAGSNIYHDHVDGEGNIHTETSIDDYGGCYTLASHYHMNPDGTRVEDDTLMDGRATEGGCFIDGVHLHVDADGNFISGVVHGAVFDLPITKSDKKGGCFTKEVYHSHDDSCYYYYHEHDGCDWDTCPGHFARVVGNGDGTKNYYDCSECGTTLRGHTNSSHGRVYTCGNSPLNRSRLICTKGEGLEYYARNCDMQPNNWWLMGCMISTKTEVDGETVFTTVLKDGFEYNCFSLNCGMTEDTAIESVGGEAGSNYVNENYFNVVETFTVKAEEGSFYMEYGGSNSTYIAPCDGWFDITAIGGAGGDFSLGGSSKVGGNGAVVNGKLHLEKGDIVKVVVGGKASSFNYGGLSNDSKVGANGGGATTVFVNNKLVMVAGGGGGASWADNGGDAGVGGMSTMQGQNGIAGGGGGYEGGKAASITWHKHGYGEGECRGPIYETRTHQHHYYQDFWAPDVFSNDHTWIGGEQRSSWPEHDPYEWICYHCPRGNPHHQVHSSSKPSSSTMTYKVLKGYNTCNKNEGLYGDMDDHVASTGGSNYFDAGFVDKSEKPISKGNGSVTVTLYSIDYDVVVNPNGGVWGKTEELRTAEDTILRETTRTPFELPNPVREGFEFMGWNITDADGAHYFAERDANRGMEPHYETEHLYKEIHPLIRSFLDMRNHNGNVYFKAVWMDTTSADTYNPVFGDSKSGLYFQNFNIELLNSDSNLMLATDENAYSISRQDGDELNIYLKEMAESYSNRYSDRVVGLRKEGNKYVDYVALSQYPNYFGVTSDGQIYYPGTWTNKSVKLAVNAYDGYYNGENFVYNRNGGSGIYRMRFDEYTRVYSEKLADGTFADSVTDTKYEDWIYSNKDLTDNSSMSINKIFSESGVYSGITTIEDRAGIANNADRGSWIAQEIGTVVVKNYDGDVLSEYKNTNGNNLCITKYSEVKIDKDSPYVLDPSKMDNNTQKFRDAMYMMYEGYNDVRDVANGDKYGWSMDNVRIVVYADDGAGSGVVEQAYCWNGDPNIASHWQSADAERAWNGKNMPVSTRVVDENESGYVYVRDAVGNWYKMDYIVDHIDKQVPTVYPEKDPIPEPGKEDLPLPPDPLDPDDKEVKEYEPIPGGPYTFEASLSTNEIKYDWVNHDATLSFKAIDYLVNKDNTKVDPSKKEEGAVSEPSKSGSSGIWKMTLYHSDSTFPTVTETLKNGKTRQRADVNLYGSNTVASEALFKPEFKHVEVKEGINYFILEVLDKAENLTMIKLTVKIDKTFPGIPYLKSEGSVEAFGVQNGKYTIGNDLLSNFGSGKYWNIEQADLDLADYNNVEAYIQNEDNMKCQFEFKIYDQNWSGKYAMGSDRTIDSSGFDKVTLKLVDADNSSVHASYVLYDYNDTSAIGTNTFGESFDTNIVEYTKTNENFVSYINGALTGEPYAYIYTVSKINTFKDFPSTCALNYEIEVIDRAGNIKTYSNEPGNEIRNFSVKAVMHSAENEEFNNEVTYEQENVAVNETDVTRITYVYKNRKGVEFGSSYALSDEEMEERGLEYVGQSVWNGKSVSAVPSSVTALTNVPYYQLGDIGFVEVWTVGYVPKIQFNFGVLGDNVGDEMVTEIKDGRVPYKYNLGVDGDSSETAYHRYIPCTSAEKIPVSYANDVSGIPFASHYGVQEAIDFENPSVDTQSGWLDKGTSIRLPLYLELEPDGTTKGDGQENFKAELHGAAFYAWKGSWKDTSTASYIIYDTRADDVHYRVTHES